MNLTFDKVQYLFVNSHTLTAEKVKDCKPTFWQDDKRSEALSTFAFKGWIAHFGIMSGGGSNHFTHGETSATARREAIRQHFARE